MKKNVLPGAHKKLKAVNIKKIHLGTISSQNGIVL